MPATSDLLIVVVASVVGAVGGALVPVPAYRLAVPADEPNRSTCGECGDALPGWVALPARCPRCGQRWGPRPWLPALAGGGACALLAWVLRGDPALPLFLALAVLGVLLGAIDLRCKRLPHALVVPAIAIGFAGLVVTAALTAHWAQLGRGVLGAAVLGGVFLLLYLLPGQGLGFGDVKLAVLLGLFLGWLGWPQVVLGALLPWLLNGPVVVVLLLSGRVSRRSTLPFGPALMVGCLLAAPVSVWLALVGRL